MITTALIGALSCLGCKNSAPATGEKSSGGLLSGVTSKSGCYNAYYPATSTLKKTYKTVFTGGNLPPSTHTESFTNIANDGFRQKMEFAPSETKAAQKTETLTVEGDIKCKPEGLMAMEYGSLSMGQNTKFKFKTIKAEGISFPNESDWKVGKKWEMNYQVEGQVTGAPSPAMNMAPKGTIVMDAEIVGEESVAVPAGTFQTFKVVMAMHNKLSMSMMGREIPMDNTFKMISWFAKDVGMVKSQVELVGTTTELITLTK